MENKIRQHDREGEKTRRDKRTLNDTEPHLNDNDATFIFIHHNVSALWCSATGGNDLEKHEFPPQYIIVNINI